MTKAKNKTRGTRKNRPQVRRTPELEKVILDGISAGQGLAEVCKAPGMPDESSVRKWAVTDLDFGERFKVARMIQSHAFVDKLQHELFRPNVTFSTETGEKIDPGDVNLRRLRIDTFKWILSKMLPKLYGEKLTLSADPDAPFTKSNAEIMREVMAILAVAKSRQLANNRIPQESKN